jgi:hypothetical protein
LHENCVTCSVSHNTSAKIPASDLWHYRLGHPSNDVLRNLQSQFPFVKYKPIFVCDACHLGKLPFPNKNLRCKTMFEIVHMDIWGPINIDCTHGHRYFLTMVDDFTRHTWIHLIKSKSDVKQPIIKFIAYVKNQFNCSIKTIRSNNGPEFLLTDLFDSHGILHQRSCVETPEQNSVVERKHRHIQNVARSLLFHFGIPKCYWCFIFSYVVHIINCLPSRILKQQSPFQLLHGKSPSLLDFKTFGCCVTLPQPPKIVRNFILEPQNVAFLVSNKVLKVLSFSIFKLKIFSFQEM